MFVFLRKCATICHMKKLNYYFKKAIKNGFALGAFNFSNLETLISICQAAEKTNSPVMACVSEGAIKYIGIDFVVSMVKTAKKQYKAPIFLHLDHGQSFEMCALAVDKGFDSVMIDASALPFEENVKLTKRVVDYAHKKGVFVEGELGQIKGIEDELSNDENHFTNPLQAQQFVQKTGVDSLAVAIGTSHGAYKFNGEAKLRFDILSEIEAKLPSFPLVLHGASSVNQDFVNQINSLGGALGKPKGVDEKLTHVAITKHNVVKINIDTDLRMAFTAAVRSTLATNPQNFDPRKYLQAAKDNMQQVVEHKIKNLLNSKNMA